MELTWLSLDVVEDTTSVSLNTLELKIHSTKVTTGDHDTVRLPEDLVKVGDTLLVLDLDDDLDVCTIGAEDLTDVEDILGATDEGRKDHVDAILNTETEVVLVLLGQGWKIELHN